MARGAATKLGSLSPSFTGRGKKLAYFTSLVPVLRTRLPCQIASFSAFGRAMPSRMRSVSHVYYVHFSGSNGQSDANTTLSWSKKARPVCIAGSAEKVAESAKFVCLLLLF